MAIKHMLLLITTALLLQTPSLQAEPDWTNASRLADNCLLVDSQNGVRSGACLGFFNGVLQTYAFYQYVMWVKPRVAREPVCLPDEITVGQMRKIFLKYINEHPEQLHMPAVEVVFKSLAAAFPCTE